MAAGGTKTLGFAGVAAGAGFAALKAAAGLLVDAEPGFPALKTAGLDASFGIIPLPCKPCQV